MKIRWAKIWFKILVIKKALKYQSFLQNSRKTISSKSNLFLFEKLCHKKSFKSFSKNFLPFKNVVETKRFDREIFSLSKLSSLANVHCSIVKKTFKHWEKKFHYRDERNDTHSQSHWREKEISSFLQFCYRGICHLLLSGTDDFG